MWYVYLNSIQYIYMYTYCPWVVWLISSDIRLTTEASLNNLAKLQPQKSTSKWKVIVGFHWCSCWFLFKIWLSQKDRRPSKIMHVKQQLSQRHCTTWMNWTESYWKTWNSSQKPSAWNEVPLGVVKLATPIWLLCFWSTNPFTTCKGKIIIFHVWSIHPPLLKFLWTVFMYTYPSRPMDTRHGKQQPLGLGSSRTWLKGLVKGTSEEAGVVLDTATHNETPVKPGIREWRGG